LARPASVVRLRRDVLDARDLETRRLQRANCRLPAGAGALDIDLYLLKAVFHALLGSRLRRHLGGEWSGLARALEPCSACRLPRDHVSLAIGERDDRVVERSLDVRL